MFEIQGDAGGCRFVAAIETTGTPISFHAPLEVGVEWKAIVADEVEVEIQGHPVKAVFPALFQLGSQPVKSLFIHATKPLELLVGNVSRLLDPKSPIVWFESWGVPCQIDISKPQEVSAIATEEGTTLTLIVTV
jgi:hypothetical protein